MSAKIGSCTSCDAVLCWLYLQSLFCFQLQNKIRRERIKLLGTSTFVAVGCTCVVFNTASINLVIASNDNTTLQNYLVSPRSPAAVRNFQRNTSLLVSSWKLAQKKQESLERATLSPSAILNLSFISSMINGDQRCSVSYEPKIAISWCPSKDNAIQKTRWAKV